jgi:hypothetical protein
VRHLEPGRVLERVAEQDQIEIEGAGGARERPLAALGLLDGQEAVEELARGERRLPDRDGIQVERLILKPFPVRLGLNNFGEGEAVDEGREVLGGERHRRPAIAKVGADGNRDSGHDENG